MRPDIRFVLLVLLTLVLSPATAPANAAASPPASAVPTSPVSPADAQQLIDTLQDPTRRAALIQTLENLRKAAQTASTSTSLPATAQPVGPLKPDSLGAQIIARGTRLADTVSASVLLGIRAAADIPDLLRWARTILQDPTTLLDGASSAARFLCVMLIAAACELLVWRLTHRFYVSLAADAHQQDKDGPEKPRTGFFTTAYAVHRRGLTDGWLLLLRLPIILMALTVDLLPPLVFLAVATLVSDTPLAQSSDVRTVILAVVDAYVIVRVVSAVARAAFGAPSARLRLLPVSDDAARYLTAWVRRIAILIVFGYAMSQLALFFGMDNDTQQGLLRLVSLLVHVMLIVMVLQCRVGVAVWLSGAGDGFFATLRHRLASMWHVYAIIFIIGGWFVYAAEIQDGFNQLIHLMLLAIGIGLLARVADIVLVGALDRGFALAHGDQSGLARFGERAARYHQPLRFLLRSAITILAFGVLLQMWGVDILDWFNRGALGDRLAGSVATLLLTLGIAIAIWEAINVWVQVYLDKLSLEGAAVRAARLRTIVPLLRNTLLITLLVLITLTAMSELGVNIGPLLAGASIFGVALGFGSQKLVQDLITGIFLLLENAMQVGDGVTAGGLSGTVENLSIRTLRLRAGDGSVHIIPFSSVSTVTNTNRGLGNATVSVTVDYEEDTDQVGDMLGQIVTGMRGEEAFANGMLSDLQLWGVDHVDGTTVTLAGQIVCTDTARWAVQREFNRRVKIAFQEAGIRLTPSISVTSFRHPLDVKMEPPPVEESTAPDARRPQQRRHAPAK